MDDDQFVIAHSVIDEIGVAGDRKHANAGNVSVSPEGGMSREQLARRANLANDGCRRT
jgi:hypothetical protein